MGRGRNAVDLAQQGWDVTGFDTSKVGSAEAPKAAVRSGVKIRTVLAPDEEFDFRTEQWDLIAIIYPIDKRRVYRVRQALRNGGIVVVECSHKESANAPFEYDTNELLQEDVVAEHEWARKQLRLVRLIAEK